MIHNSHSLLDYRFPIVKLPPLPCAVLLVSYPQQFGLWRCSIDVVTPRIYVMTKIQPLHSRWLSWVSWHWLGVLTKTTSSQPEKDPSGTGLELKRNIFTQSEFCNNLRSAFQLNLCSNGMPFHVFRGRFVR